MGGSIIQPKDKGKGIAQVSAALAHHFRFANAKGNFEETSKARQRQGS